MILPILKYGHPMLRQKGAKIDRATPEILTLVENMKETMRAAKGVGLAAQQVGSALQLAIVDVRDITDRPSTLFMDGSPVELDEFMPLVLINPQVQPIGEPVAASEGCLSFPEIYSEIIRPETVEVKATNESGRRVQFRCGGLLARAIQHEVDHLNGILFIDRMGVLKKKELKAELDELQAETKARLEADTEDQ